MSDLARPDAQALVEAIEDDLRALEANVDALMAHVLDAWRGRVWLALGYGSWDALCDARIRVPRLEREQRREIVEVLRSEGMSTRAIAPVVGVDQATVVRDDASTDANASVDRVTSLDGRSRPATQPVIEPDEALIAARFRHAFAKSMSRAHDVLAYDVERVALLASEDHVRSVEHLVIGFSKYLERLRELRRPHVIRGGRQ